MVVSVAACKTTSPHGSERTSEGRMPPTSGAVLQTPTVRARMKDHEMHGVAIRDAVARGDLDGARRAATTLAGLRLDDGIDPAWKQKLAAMNVAAGRVADATDLTAASRGLGLIAKTCGDCHTMLARPGPIVGEPPGQDSGVRPRMMRHEWAAAQLWDGLVVPSDDAWKAGAGVLAEAPLAPELLTLGKTPVPRVGALAASVHDLGRRAETLEHTEARMALLGELMASCADCHQWLGGGPSSTKSR
jgi:cytochrome c553